MTTDGFMFISPTCCAPFTLGHKMKKDTLSCGDNLTQKKGARRLMATKKAGAKKGAKKAAAKRPAAKKGAAKKGGAKGAKKR